MNTSNDTKRELIPVNVNRGHQKYCFTNALGNALNIHIDRDKVDKNIEELNQRTKGNHGISKVGNLSTHGLNFCVQRLVPEFRLIRYRKALGAKRMIRYLKFHRPKAGIIYGWKSYPTTKKKNTSWESLSHAIAFKDGHFINDFSYKKDMLCNVSNIDTDKNCLLRHFEKKMMNFPYTFRFYNLVRLPDRVLKDDKVLKKRKKNVTLRPNKRPGKRERLQALQAKLSRNI